MLRDYLPAGPIVLDASAIINILGCGQTEAIFRGLSRQCIVEERTLAEIIRHPVPGVSHIEVLAQLREAGVLRVERMNTEEYGMYITLIQGSLSARLDVGESASIAVAISRGYGIILDENKARRIFASLPGRSEYASTLKLFISAAFNMSWDIFQLADVVATAKRTARLGVPKEDAYLIEHLSQ